MITLLPNKRGDTINGSGYAEIKGNNFRVSIT